MPFPIDRRPRQLASHCIDKCPPLRRPHWRVPWRWGSRIRPRPRPRHPAPAQQKAPAAPSLSEPCEAEPGHIWGVTLPFGLPARFPNPPLPPVDPPQSPTHVVYATAQWSKTTPAERGGVGDGEAFENASPARRPPRQTLRNCATKITHRRPWRNLASACACFTSG